MLERHGLRDNGLSFRTLGGTEPNIEPRAARVAVAYRYAGAVCPNDLHDDRQAQTGTVGTNAFAAPEALKDALPILVPGCPDRCPAR